MNSSVVTTDNQLARGNWHHAMLALVLSIASIFFFYWDTAQRIVSIWIRSETFAHCFLILPIVAWLIWRRREDLMSVRPTPSFWMLAPLALIAFAWLLGNLTATNAVTFLSLVSLVVLAVITVLGTRAAKVIAFPLAYLFFAVPTGDFVMPKMMEWTADFTVRALMLTGIPVYREGQNFVIPSGSWSVVEACSGVRYLIASVVVGTLYAYLNYRSLHRRLIFIAVSLAVPIVANWLRAYMIVMLGHLSGNKLAVGVDHLIYGWLFFGVVILLMFLIGARWAEHPGANECTGAVTAQEASVNPGRLWLAAVLFVFVMASPHGWLAAIDQAEASSAGVSPSLTLAAPVAWQVAEPPAIDWRPAYTSARADWQGEFAQDERRVGVFIGYYRQQDYDHKLISSGNELVKSSDRAWLRVSEGGRGTMLAGQPLAVRTAELRGPGEQRIVVWYWYWINGRLTVSDHVAKAWQAFDRLLGRGDSSAVVILYAPKTTDGGEVALESFLASIGAGIDASLRQASR